MLAPWVRSSRRVRVFPDGWSDSVAAFAPEVIAGTWLQLESLAVAATPSISHALIVLVRPGGPCLTEAQRERLWKVFHVPVFEQIIGDHGTLLAAECEAHDGLHIESPMLATEGYFIEKSPCGCGRQSPRLKPAGRGEAVRAATV